ncbi:MAG: hypothetical protein HZB84_00815 [Deltaproteobacteria bacterium]|nr:hypothetical protein [Deltaproteobacteria bacterium]
MSAWAKLAVRRKFPNQGGVSWSLAHLLPDIAIHSASIAAAVWLALRSDRALQSVTVEKSAEAVAA